MAKGDSADAIIHNKDGCYQCEESWSRVTVVINYSDLLVGYDTVIANSDFAQIVKFQPTAPTGTETQYLVDAHATVPGHTYGVPYTLFYYRAAYAVQSNAPDVALPASGGREIIGLAVDDNAFPSCSCPYPGTQNDLTLSYTVTGATPTPTPTSTPRPTVGADVTKNNHKLGGNECSLEAPAAMARYSVHSQQVSLNVEDRPLRYTPAVGPSIDFTVTYNQRETQQPAAFAYSNLGPKWTFGWLSYVSDDPNSQLPLTGLYRSGGGAEIFAFDSGSQTFIADAQTHAMLVKTGPAAYERRMPDGSKEIFGLSDGATAYPRRIFLTQVVDPFGNSVAIGYDASFRVTTIMDALIQVTTLSYELQADPLKITRVTDPFGRFATFEYTSGQLTKITDEIGIQSQFTYTPGTDSMNSLTTPYGTTTFVSGENGTNRWIEMTDPLGGKERVESGSGARHQRDRTGSAKRHWDR